MVRWAGRSGQQRAVACFVVQAAESPNGAKGCGNRGGRFTAAGERETETVGGTAVGGTLGFVAISEGKSQKVNNKHQNGTQEDEVTMERAPWGRLDPVPFTWMVDGDLRAKSVELRMRRGKVGCIQGVPCACAFPRFPSIFPSQSSLASLLAVLACTPCPQTHRGAVALEVAWDGKLEGKRSGHDSP